MVSSRLTGGVLGRTLDSIPPATGAEVMGTGIVSTALSLDGQETLSRVILVIAAVIWVTLAMLLPLRAARDPAGFRADARTPAALIAAVATAVLGTRLTLLGWAWAGIAALVIAFVLWAALLRPVLAGWKSPTVGVSLLLAVTPESIAVLAATLAAPEHARWLLIAALVLFGVGLGLYLFVISRFDFHQLAVGRGDHWITGGALGIAALAGAKIALAAKALGVLGGLGGALEDIAIGLWVLTMLWLLVLLFAEARWPRLSVAPARWSTVFPLGMYAVSSFTVGVLARAAPITSFARVWVWIALASWTIVLLATIGRAPEVLRGHGPRPDSPAPEQDLPAAACEHRPDFEPHPAGRRTYVNRQTKRS
jgi:tellurite resistance protein TehA-like permease